MVLGFSKVKNIFFPSPYLVKIRTVRAHSEKLLCALSTTESFSPVVVNPQAPSEQARIQDTLSQINDYRRRMEVLASILSLDLPSTPINDCSILPLARFFDTVESFLSQYEHDVVSLSQTLSNLESSIDLFSSLSDFLVTLDLHSTDLFSEKTHTFTAVGTIPASYEDLIKFYLHELTGGTLLYWSDFSHKDSRYKVIFVLSLLDYKEQIIHTLKENHFRPLSFTDDSLKLLSNLKETRNVNSLISQLRSELNSVQSNLLTFKSAIGDKLSNLYSRLNLCLIITDLESLAHSTSDHITLWVWVSRKDYPPFTAFLDSLDIAVDYSILSDVPFKYRKSPHPASKLTSILEPSKSLSPKNKDVVPKLSKRGRHGKSYPLFPKKSLFIRFEVLLKYERMFLSAVNSLGILHPVKMGVLSDYRVSELSRKKAEFENYKSRIQQLITKLDIPPDYSADLIGSPEQKISIIDEYKHSKAFILNLLNDYEEKIDDLCSKKEHLERKINQLKFYLPFERMFSEQGLKLNFLESGLHTFVLLGSIPERHYKAVNFFLREVTDNNALYWFSDPDTKGDVDRKNIFIVALKDYEDAIFRVLNEYNFERLDIETLELEKVMSTSDIIHSLSLELDKINEEISKERKGLAIQLLAAIELINNELARLEIESYGQIIDDKFVLWGWIPEEKKSVLDQLKNSFGDSINIVYEDNVPLVTPSITNSGKILGVFRGLVDGLGVPNPHEVDPYFFMRFTFPILFAIMFADLAHGFMLVLIGLFLVYKKKKNKIEPDESITGYLYKGAGLLIYTGLFSMIFGILFGTFLGDEELLPELYAQLDIKWLPVILNPLHQVKTLLAFSLIIGFILMQFAIWLKVIQNIRYGHDRASVLAPIFLSIFYVGLFAILYNLICKNTEWNFGALHLSSGEIVPFKVFTFPAIPSTIINILLIIALVAMILVFIMEYLHNKTDGIMDAIDHVLALLSNTLSFSRLMALLLVHAILAGIPFRLINGLVPLSPLWWVAGLLMGILIIIPLEGLLSFLNSLRLHWVELFNKFYVGDGMAYKPIKSSLSYVKLKKPDEE